MKPRIINLIILSLCVLFTSTVAETELMIITEEWAPYNYADSTKLTGFSTEIVEQILKLLDEEHEITLLPSMRTTFYMETKPNTMMFSLFRNEKREEKYKWIGPLIDGSIYVYKRKNTAIEIKSIDDMKKYHLCCRHGGTIHDLLIAEGFEDLDLYSTNSIQVYKKLLMGRCDIAISDTDLGARYYLKTIGLNLDDVFEKIPIPIFEAELYIAATKDIPDETIARWQAALDTLKANGIYNRIVKKYL